MLLYAGWRDTGITPENTVLYYESVREEMLEAIRGRGVQVKVIAPVATSVSKLSVATSERSGKRCANSAGSSACATPRRMTGCLRW